VYSAVSSVYYSYKIMVEKVMHITSEYEEVLRRCQYVRRLSFGRRMLRDDGAPNSFSLTLARLVSFFLITYQHSLFSIHSSSKFIRTILIIFRLHLELFFLITYHPPFHSSYRFLPSLLTSALCAVLYVTSVTVAHNTHRYTSVADKYFARRHIGATILH